MKTYRYKAKRGPAEIEEGLLKADSRDQALDKIGEMGLIAVEISEYAERKGGQDRSSRPRPVTRVKRRELTSFYRQLGKLVRSGIPILRALKLISDEGQGQGMRQVAGEIHLHVREGNNLSSAMGRFPRVFSPFDRGMIETGEVAGRLDEALSQIAEYHNNQDALVSRVRMSLAYPAFVVGMGFLTVGYLLTAVIPKFAQFFKDLGQELPLMTRLLIGFSEGLQAMWGWGLILLTGGTILMVRLYRSKKYRAAIDGMILGIPRFGELVFKSEMARLARTLELLLKSGIPILSGLRLAIPVVKNTAMQHELLRCYALLEDGGYLSAGLRESKIFPPFVFQMLSIGEESGRLDESLAELADWYTQDTNESIKIMTNLLEPVIILAIGLVLTFIIVAVLLPVFSINTMAI